MVRLLLFLRGRGLRFPNAMLTLCRQNGG